MILSALSAYKNKYHRRYFTSKQPVINHSLLMDPRRHYFNPSNGILGFGSNHTFPCSIPNQVDIYNMMTKRNTPSPYPPLVPLLPLPLPPVPPEPPPPMPLEPRLCQPTCKHSLHHPLPVFPTQKYLLHSFTSRSLYINGYIPLPVDLFT